MDELEIRTFDLTELRLESREDGKLPLIKGHAAVFNKLSNELWKGVRERIDPGAFDEALGADVRGLFNHDANHVLGRTKSGTLKLGTDKEGLRFVADPPDTHWVRDLQKSIDRGDIDQASFAFRTIKDQWTHDEEKGTSVRTLLKVELRDVSVVTFPAYPQTDVKVAQRSMEAWSAELAREGGAAAALAVKIRARHRELELLSRT